MRGDNIDPLRDRWLRVRLCLPFALRDDSRRMHLYPLLDTAKRTPHLRRLYHLDDAGTVRGWLSVEMEHITRRILEPPGGSMPIELPVPVASTSWGRGLRGDVHRVWSSDHHDIDEHDDG